MPELHAGRFLDTFVFLQPQLSFSCLNHSLRTRRKGSIDIKRSMVTRAYDNITASPKFQICVMCLQAYHYDKSCNLKV